MNLKEYRAEEPSGATTLCAGLVRVGLPSPTLAPATHTNSYLIRDAAGWTLWDVGGMDLASMGPLFAALDALDAPLQAIAISHEHLDHHSGLVFVRARYPDVPIVAHPHVLARLRAHYSDAPWLGLLEARNEGDRLAGGELWLTEGHALGHLSLVHEAWVLCADMMAGFGTIVVALPEGSMVDYFASLERLAGLDDRPCYPAHGPELPSTRGYARAFLAHRQAREAKIFGALRVESQTLGAITKRAYEELAAELLPIAEVATLAHLDKLGAEGLAAQNGPLWRLVAGGS